MRDEQVGDPALGLQLDEQVEDRGLHGDVQRRRWLVADHQLGLAGERARYRQALELQPEDSIIHFHLADALAADGKRAEALVGLREAIRLRPGFWEARYLLGVELALEEKIPEAKEQFAEVVRLRPDYALGHLNLGVALVKEGRMDDALIQFRETLRLDPQNL